MKLNYGPKAKTTQLDYKKTLEMLSQTAPNVFLGCEDVWFVEPWPRLYQERKSNCAEPFVTVAVLRGSDDDPDVATA